ncbi:MAG: HAD family phosphatase [Thermodesulfovibrionales bacterium]
MEGPSITTLFLDIGGVLLTNGWDRGSRRRAAETFGLDYTEMDERHHLTFGTYEEGKLSLHEYVNRVIFYEPRPFTREEFREFMFSRSRPHQEMIDLVRGLKARHGLKIVTLSNEGRELTLYRINAFSMAEYVDLFISSCFVHYRKPDTDIYRIAMDISQVRPSQAVYIDDRAMFVEIARSLGINGIHHTGTGSTRSALEGYGLTLPEETS